MSYDIEELMADYMEQELVLEEAGVCRAERIEKLVMSRLAEQRRRRPRRWGRTLLIAAAVALLLAVSALAVALGRVQLVAENGQVHFERRDEEPVYLGAWELKELPEGFAFAASDYDPAICSVLYENEAGEQLVFTYEKAGAAEAARLPEDGEAEMVTVGGGEGLLFDFEHGSRLFWTDEERGIGFSLEYTGTGPLDLVPVAEGAGELELQPTEQAVYALERALDDLGDYQVELPAGYELFSEYGSPLSFGYGVSAEVHRCWANEKYYSIRLDYERVQEGETLEQFVQQRKHWLSNQEKDLAEIETEVNGIPALLLEEADGSPNALLWLDSETRLLFSLEADGLGSEELLALAQTVKKR